MNDSLAETSCWIAVFCWKLGASSTWPSSSCVEYSFLMILLAKENFCMGPISSFVKNRMKEMRQMMLMITAIPTKTVAALKAGERMVPKSSSRPRQISVPSWLKC